MIDWLIGFFKITKFQRGTPDRFRSKPRGRSASPHRSDFFSLSFYFLSFFFSSYCFLLFLCYIFLSFALLWLDFLLLFTSMFIYLNNLYLLHNISLNQTLLNFIANQCEQTFVHSFYFFLNTHCIILFYPQGRVHGDNIT